MRALGLGLLVLALACTRAAPDPLAPFLESCRALEQKKELRAGLTAEQCARDLKAAADAADPAKRAAELVDRVEGLVRAGKSGGDATQRMELRDAVMGLQALGRPAVAPVLARFNEAKDADVRLALAKPLVNLCASDCATESFACIVPALLEGTTEDKPPEVRLESIKGLARCTGKGFGDDAKAWREWWTRVAPK